ncbi:MAG: glycosyltransferase [Planctomycetaceae bacterium]|nr:glycosyltransferase [Planctomycetaceae bacterium]
MAAYNAEQYLQPSIQSLLAQSLRDFELIIVEDGSKDNTFDILNELQRQDKRVRVIRNEQNIGLAASLNRGIQAARAALIARADADDVYDPKRLELQCTFMQDHPEVTVVGSAVTFISSDGRTLSQSADTTFPVTADDVRLHSLLGCCLWHTTVMFRKTAIQNIGGYNTEFRGGPEDYDLWSRLLNDHKLVNISETLAQVRLHISSVTANWNKGLEMFCGVSATLIRSYIGTAVDSESVEALVTMCSYGGDITQRDHEKGLELLRKVLAAAREREATAVYRKFRRKCAMSLVQRSSELVYRAPNLAWKLLRHAFMVDPSIRLMPGILRAVARLSCPSWLRSTARSIMSNAKQ